MSPTSQLRLTQARYRVNPGLRVLGLSSKASGRHLVAGCCPEKLSAEESGFILKGSCRWWGG